MNQIPPVWVVSLERATDRRAFVREVFEPLRIPYEIVDAVDGYALDDRQLAQCSELRALFRYGERLRPGILGCSLSHLEAYRRMVSEDIPEVVIVEDDARPSPDFGRVLTELEAVPSDCDVLTFHSLFEWAAPTPVNDSIIAGKYRICTFGRTPMGTQAYLITQAAARRVLKVAYPVCLPSDELLFRARPARLTVYGVDPSPVTHGAFDSEIHAIRSQSPVESEALSPIQRAISLAGRAERRILSVRDGIQRRWPASPG